MEFKNEHMAVYTQQALLVLNAIIKIARPWMLDNAPLQSALVIVSEGHWVPQAGAVCLTDKHLG